MKTVQLKTCMRSTCYCEVTGIVLAGNIEIYQLICFNISILFVTKPQKKEKHTKKIDFQEMSLLH
jgi:hypothetical protein